MRIKKKMISIDKTDAGTYTFIKGACAWDGSE